MWLFAEMGCCIHAITLEAEGTEDGLASGLVTSWMSGRTGPTRDGEVLGMAREFIML